MTVLNLKVDNLKDPIGIDNAPRFSWEIKSDRRGCYQESYRIIISSNKGMDDLIYDSGFIRSSESVNVQPKDLSIHPSQRYYWNVSIIDDMGIEAVSKEDAFFETGLMASGWDGAQWISAPTKETSVPRFRKALKINKTIKKAVLYSTALGIYDFYINGHRIGTIQEDGTILYEELKPGWTYYNKSVAYYTHDVTSFLKKGNNILGAIVADGWWKGNISRGMYGNKDVALLAKLQIQYTDGSCETVITDSTWDVNSTGPLISSDIWDGDNYDARKEDEWMTSVSPLSWDKSVMSDYSGDVISLLGTETRMVLDKKLNVKSIKIYDEVVKDNGTDFGIMNLFAEYNNPTFPFVLKKGQTAIFDFAQNMVGWTPFRIKGGDGVKLRIRYSEMLNDTGLKSRGNDGPGGSLYLENLREAKALLFYTFKGSSTPESYCPFSTYYGFRYCEVTATDDVEIEEIYGIPISSAIESTGYIKTDNELINQLFSNIQWGQRGNFISIPTDCPQRDERLGWTGDAQVFSRTGIYNYSSESFYRKFLYDLRNTQYVDGSYTDMCPPTWISYGNAGWSDAGIIIPWNLYLMYGNKNIISEHFESMEKYMDWMSSLSGEGFKYQGAIPTYGDWLAYDKCNNRYVSVAYYAYDALLMSKMSSALSKEKDDVYYEKANSYYTLYQQIKKEFNERFWNPIPEESTQATYLLPLAFDLLDVQKQEIALTKLKEKIKENNGLMSTGFIATSIFLPTLSKMGLGNEAYELLLQRSNPSWLYSIEQGATTIWERWDSYTAEKGFGPASMNSFNHYAYGSVGEWFYRNMAGISTDEEDTGFKHIIISPDFDLRNREGAEIINLVESEYKSYYGSIVSNWHIKHNGDIDMICSIPANTNATLYLPSSIEESDIFEGDHVASISEGIKYIGRKNGKHIYSLKSGVYHFYLHRITTSIKEDDCINNYMLIKKDLTNKDYRVYINGVKSENIKVVELFTLHGSLLKVWGSNVNTIDLTGATHGIYLLKVITSEGIRTYKINI